MKSWRASLLACAVVVLCPLAVLAGTSTGSLTVNANVNSSCIVSSGTLSFGAYDPIVGNASAPLQQSGTFQIQCTNGLTATILLGQGLNPGSGSTDSAPIRNMTNGTSQLNYQLYTTSARSTVWDNATGVSQLTTGQTQTLTVYGTIPAGQNVTAGSYSDTVVITVNY